MPPRSRVAKLPKQVKSELDRRLVDSAFSDYQGLAEWLQEKGYQVSRSTVGKYGKEFRDRLTALKDITEQARAVHDEIGDDENLVIDMLVQIAGQKLFKMLTELDLSGEKMTLPDLMGAIARISQASVGQKKWQVKVRADLEAKFKELEDNSDRAGQSLDPNTLKIIREQIYGIL